MKSQEIQELIERTRRVAEPIYTKETETLEELRKAQHKFNTAATTTTGQVRARLLAYFKKPLEEIQEKVGRVVEAREWAENEIQRLEDLYQTARFQERTVAEIAAITNPKTGLLSHLPFAKLAM